ncbi:MAG: HEAT repeat domain-containing protein [Planctomycetes bacterium]|nr:HEAT repeat domain-containing protein [Planctomycetota bacterium]
MSNSSRAGRKPAYRLFFAALLAMLPAAPAFAQDAQKLFDQGMAHYYNGDHEAAIASFRQVVAQAPDQAVAYQLLNQSQDSLLQLMVAGGEYETFAKEVLASANEASREAMRDLDAAAEVAAGCFADDFATRSKAIFDLNFRFGPFGALPLIDELGSQSEGRRLNAIYALSRMGGEAAQPVMAATYSNNEQVRAGAVLVLAELNDARAAARVTDMATNDESGMVRKIAETYAADASAAEMLYSQGWGYLDADPDYGLTGPENYGALFVADGSGVMAVDMLPSLVSCELAKREFLRSHELGNADAAIALAIAYGAEVSILTAAGEDYADVRNLQMASALTLGNEVLCAALVNAVAENRVGASRALVMMVDAENPNSAASLDYAMANARTADVRYGAAIAMAHGGNASEGVVGTLAEASTLDALRIVHLADPDDERAARLAGQLADQGIAVVRAQDGGSALINAYRSVIVDVFVVADPLPDLYASRVIKEIRKDERYSDTPFLVLGNDDSGDIEGAEILDSDDASAIVDAFGDLGADRERYLATAASAAQALAHLAANGASLGSNADQLDGALGREDAVAVPMARVIGLAGNSGSAEALMGLISDDSRSTEARAAAAKGLTTLAGRMDVSVNTDVLEALISDSDPALAMACARALAACGGAHLAATVGSE